MLTLLNETFLALFAVSLGAALLGLAALAMKPLLRGIAARWRYLLWMLLFLALLVPVRPSLGGSLVHIALPVENAATAETTSAAATTASASVAQMPTVAPAAGVEIGAASTTISSPVALRAAWLSPDVETWLDGAILPALRQAAKWLGAIWLAGALILAGYQLWRHLRFVRTVRRWSEPVSDPQLVALYGALLQELDINRAPQLAVCAGVRSPLLYGYLAPTILLPTHSIPQDEVTLILRHELIHYQRGDLWWRALVLVATALHWFNPAVYLMAQAAAAECEISCDETLLRGMDARARRRYGEAILGVVRPGGIPHSALTTTFYGGKQGMKTRIEAIMDTSTKRTGIAVLLVMALAILSTGALFAADPAQQPPAPPAAPTLPEGATSLIIRLQDGVIEMSSDGGATWQSLPDDVAFDWATTLPPLPARGDETAPTAVWVASTDLITGSLPLSATTILRPAQLAVPALPAAGVRVFTTSECEATPAGGTAPVVIPAAAASAAATATTTDDGAEAPPVLCIISVETTTLPTGATVGGDAPAFSLAQPLAAGELSTQTVEIRGVTATTIDAYAPGAPLPAFSVSAQPVSPAVTIQGGSAMAVPAQTFQVTRPDSSAAPVIMLAPTALSGTVSLTAPTTLPAPLVDGVPVVIVTGAIARDAEGGATIYGSSSTDAAPGAPVIVTSRDEEAAAGVVIDAVPVAPAIVIQRGEVDALPATTRPLLAPDAALPFTPVIADYEEVGIFADASGALTFAGRPVRLLVDNGPQGQFTLTLASAGDGLALQVERNVDGELIGVRILK